MWASRQARHQQAAAAPGAGTGTTGGSSVHQHGAALPAAFAQCSAAPQRAQRLVSGGGDDWKDMTVQPNGTGRKIQPERPL